MFILKYIVSQMFILFGELIFLLTTIKVRRIKLFTSWVILYSMDNKEIIMGKINLRQMDINQVGIISRVKANGELGRRIRDMGLIPGKEIRVQGKAPLYDPVSLRIMGFTLTQIGRAHV